MRKFNFAVIGPAIVVLVANLGGLALARAAVAEQVADVDVYVSPTGSDSATGQNLATPVQTIAQGMARIRQFRAGAKGVAATLHLSAGVYRLSKPQALNVDDSNLTIVGDDRLTTVLSGAIPLDGWTKALPPSAAVRLTPAAASHVWAAPFSGNFGTRHLWDSLTHSTNPNLPAELLVKGEPMQEARFPAHGWANVVRPSGDGSFETSPAAPERSEVVEGFLKVDSQYAEYLLNPGNSNGRVGLSGAAFAPIADGRVAFVGAVEDLSGPGQYCLDAANHEIYYWPAAEEDGPPTGTSVTQLTGPIFDAYQVQNLTIKNLTLGETRGQGARIFGCTHFVIDSVTVAATANEGLWLENGKDGTVQNCDIHATGTGGIAVLCGDEPTLTPSQVNVQNCQISRVARLALTYHPAIDVRGVGVLVQGNTITDCPDQAIVLSGSLNTITGNSISKVCEEVSDAGAIYTGQNLFNRGNLIAGNHFRDIPSRPIHANKSSEVVGVYLDDLSSGFTVQKNDFSNVNLGVEVGGGRDNRIVQNTFTDVDVPVRLDGRGKTWAAAFFAPGGAKETQFAKAGPQMVALYRSRFPDFARAMDASDPALPEGNNVSRNTFVRTKDTVKLFDTDITRPLLKQQSNRRKS